MSPLLHNRAFVAISSERISLIKLGRGLKLKVQAKYDEVLAPIGELPSWKAALDRATQLLSQPEWKTAEVNVVLSNRLARFAVITFGQQLSSYASQEAFARHVSTQTYGAVVEKWAFRIQPGKAGAPRLVTALDQGLLDGLQQACEVHQLKLNLVIPCLAPVFNRFRKMFKKDPFWLVINEPGYSLLALMSGGEFVAVNGVRHNNIDELPMLLDRENLVSPLPKPCKSVYLYTPLPNDFRAMLKTEYEFEKLDLVVPVGFPAQSEGLYAMTMSEFL